jgi:5'-nucleotidase
MLSLAGALAMGGCHSPTVTVIAMADTHGALEPYEATTLNGEKVQYGGAALMAAYVKVLRDHASGPVVLLDAGDMFQGTLVSNTVEGEPVVRFYNRLGVDAAALGNHEFDYGPEGEDSVPKHPGEDPRGALKERIREARFPVLAANVVDETGQTPSWLKRSILIERGGIKIGIVGAATIETPYTTVRANLTGLTFLDPVDPVKNEALELRRRGATFVLLTSHIGGECSDNSPEKVDDLSTCSNDELFKLLNKLPTGLIDAAVGGHTHQAITKRVNGTAVLQPWAQAKYVSWVELSRDDVKVKSVLHGPINLCGSVVPDPRGGTTCNSGVVAKSKDPVTPAVFRDETIRPDRPVVKLLQPDFDRVKAIKETPLGVSALDEFTRDYGGESAMGNLVADLMQAFPDDSAPEVGLTNNGGVRDNLSAGPLKYGHVFNVLPFDNRLAIMTVNGRTLKRIVEMGVRATGGGLSWSNLTYVASHCQVLSVLIKGQPLDESKTYRIMTNDYLATGGSGFNELNLTADQVQLKDDAPPLRDAAVTVLKTWNHDIASGDFYDRQHPRQDVQAPCTAADLAALQPNNGH